MRVIITGASGQLGNALYQELTDQGFNIIDIPDWPEIDISDHSIVSMLSGLYPELVIHCAALTDVDACAKDPESAFKINAFGTQNVAHACLRCNAEMVYISTNEVFSGRTDQPYHEDDKPQPVNPYGSSKRAGEQMASNYLRTGLYIVRTAWLFGGGHMFPEKIVAAADKQGDLKVVTDEISNPTYTYDLAAAISQLVRTRKHGIYHLVNSNYCSRYDFAREVLRLCGKEDIPVHPITLAEYVRPSVVPPFTALLNTRAATLGITLRPWQQALAAHIAKEYDG